MVVGQERVSDIARDLHISESTLRRWRDNELSASENSVTLTRGQRLRQQRYLERRQIAQMLTTVLKRLDRHDARSAHQFEVRWYLHSITSIAFRTLSTIAGLVLFAVAAVLLILAVAIFSSPAEMPFQIRIAPLILAPALTFLLALGLDVIFNAALRVFGPFAYCLSALAQAIHRITELQSRDVFLRKPWPLRQSFSEWGTFPARLRIVSSLRKAERQLTRSMAPGLGYATLGAREFDLERRRIAGASIAWVETQLHRRGPDAYTECVEILLTIMYMTFLRDWTIEDLPRHPDAIQSYSSRAKRAWRWIRGATAFAIAAVPVIVLYPQLSDLAETLRF